MIQELKQKIDQSLRNRHYNPWKNYAEAKRVLRIYEDENKIYFSHDEWMKYIGYITDVLQI